MYSFGFEAYIQVMKTFFYFFKRQQKKVYTKCGGNFLIVNRFDQVSWRIKPNYKVFSFYLELDFYNLKQLIR